MVKWVGNLGNSWEPAENLDFVEPTPNPCNNENTEYEVEKVLKKREKKGQVLSNWNITLVHFSWKYKPKLIKFFRSSIFSNGLATVKRLGSPSKT